MTWLLGAVRDCIGSSGARGPFVKLDRKTLAFGVSESDATCLNHTLIMNMNLEKVE